MNSKQIKKFETIHLSYINGQKKQMVEQMADIDIADFLEWFVGIDNVHGDAGTALALIISYFKIKEY